MTIDNPETLHTASAAPAAPQQLARGANRLTPEQFKSVFRQHPAGVTVVTLRHQEHLIGFTATSVISVSADPPLLAFSVAGQSSSWAPLSSASTLVVNFLGADQADLSARFATSNIDRFACGGWSLLETGEPFLHGSANWVRGQIVQRTPVGSSFLVSVEALDTSARNTDCVAGEAGLVYVDRMYHRLGTTSAL
jgi:flavin reductase (DIM6/NTAB) family NADH-FMN oxidoreductase RutF